MDINHSIPFIYIFLNYVLYVPLQSNQLRISSFSVEFV